MEEDKARAGELCTKVRTRTDSSGGAKDDDGGTVASAEYRLNLLVSHGELGCEVIIFRRRGGEDYATHKEWAVV